MAAPRSRAGIEATVRAVTIEHLGADKAKAADLDARFDEDLGADNLDMIELVMFFEAAYDIEISDDAALGVSRLRDAANLIERLVQA
jgi:acyl carrier protein